MEVVAARFRAHLKNLEVTDVTVHVAAFALQEGYNTGWGGTAVVVASRESESLGAGNMMGAVMASGVVAGAATELNLTAENGPFHGVDIRSWPCVVNGMRPYEIDRSSAACDVHLVDPVSFLADQPIWGAYRAVSAGEMIGGALSLAAGGDGKPKLSPVLPRLPSVRIVEDYRNDLKRLPYAIAAGQTLGDWLADFLAMLGLRAELRGLGNGVLEMTLLDSKPRRAPLRMTVVSDDGSEQSDGAAVDPNSHGPILIRGHSGFPGSPLRGGLLDDPSTGSARPLATSGPVGTVLTGSELDIDEATNRIFRSVQGTHAEMLMLSVSSRQPGFRPGELVSLSQAMHGLRDWQTASVSHMLRDVVYDNDATLIRGDLVWYPELPLYRPPVFVSGVVDGGPDFDVHQPVPRDRLGRIKISFPFTPTPVGQELDELVAADTDKDGRITLADFDEATIENFTANSAYWEAEEAKYQAGEYDDPFPGKPDEELTEDQAQTRTDYDSHRQNAVAYMAYKKARRLDEDDADRDGVISARDEVISNELSEKLKDEEEYRQIREQWEEEQEWAARPEGDQDTDVPEFHDEPERLELVREYGDLFGEDEREDLGAEEAAAREDAEDAADRWPPRIPLPVINPMAGALHGFIAAHRHGDICRVAVHDPFSAEIVGFQYRDDRKINADLSDAVAGLVVEHNHSEAWSGLVFRKTEAVEGDQTTTGEDDGQGSETNA